MKIVRVIRIDRKTWLRGQEGVTMSFLLRPSDGKMCCLGFACEQSGIPRSRLYGVAGPFSFELPWVVGNSNASILVSMMSVNDRNDISDAHRELALSDLAEQVGLQFEFYN